MTGLLVGVVGPSGVGKDTIMAAISEAAPEFGIVRRVITRSAELGGEDFDGVTETEFLERQAAEQFCIDWEAHGLRYGIPREVRSEVEDGRALLVNLSRAVLVPMSEIFANFAVLNITAQPETLAKRLADRGRETAADIESRLRRQVNPLPQSLSVHTIENDGRLEETVADALARLRPLLTENAMPPANTSSTEILS